MSSPSPSHDSYEPWDPFEDVSSQQQTQASKLSFCQYSDWDSERTYDEDPPRYIRYAIEWKVTVNKRMISKDTEHLLQLYDLKSLADEICAQRRFSPMSANPQAAVHF